MGLFELLLRESLNRRPSRWVEGCNEPLAVPTPTRGSLHLENRKIIMIRANVYTTTQGISPDLKTQIGDGLDLVSEFVGGISLSKVLKLKLPSSNEGVVSRHRIGYKNLDPFVELHLLALPLGADGRLGGSYLNTGISFLNLSEQKTHFREATVAHEVAHSLGYVLKDSPQHDQTRHCTDECCIMSPKQNYYNLAEEVLDEVATDSYAMADLLKGFGLNTQTEFCMPCVADMRDTHEEQIGSLRLERLSLGHVRAASYNLH